MRIEIPSFHHPWRDWLWHLHPRSKWLQKHCANEIPCCCYLVLCRRSMKLRSKRIWLITCHLIINKSVKILIALGLCITWPVGACTSPEKMDELYLGWEIEDCELWGSANQWLGMSKESQGGTTTSLGRQICNITGEFLSMACCHVTEILHTMGCYELIF
jgi:hypothetical protein